MKGYDIKKRSGGYTRWTYGTYSNDVRDLPSWLRNPFRRIGNKYNGRSMDLHQGRTSNMQPVNLRRNRGSDEAAQDWDIDRKGRIRSRVNPRKCLEAGKDGYLYRKVFLYDCHDGLWQRWDFFTDGRIRNKHHRFYLGVAYCGTNSDPNKQSIELRNYEGGQCGEAQKWNF